ncbi:MAG: 1-acyl-sn-glycerol-3-phosphate acyltransferase [Clostridia bacterium]|nr:1-acyl-sn-glycerol-3-phosphate acyltransferase [Clostridia bacterium]
MIKDDLNFKNLSIEERIEYLEKNGMFDIDPNDDPENIVLMPDKVDYLEKKLSTKVSTFVANRVASKFINKLIKQEKLIIKDIVGLEHINSIDSGFIITCNHFHPFDNFAIQKLFEKSKHFKKRKLYKVIREGNYTNFKGLYGYFFRHCNTLPLSSNKHTMMKFVNAVNTALNDGNIILIYPEQSLWLNYQKPKPLKIGGFKFAYNNNIPILPCFITFFDSDKICDNQPVKEYTINVLPPIYPNKDNDSKVEIGNMMNKNFELWKEVYEKTYNKKLEYITENKEKVLTK